MWRNDLIDAWQTAERERLDRCGLLDDDAIDAERAELEDDRPHLTLVRLAEVVEIWPGASSQPSVYPMGPEAA